MKRLLSVVSLILVFSLIGCGNDKVEKIVVSENINGQENKEVTELSWYINFSWFATKWGGNLVSDAITEKTGVTVDFITPTGDPTDKVKAMIDSNTLPDIVTMGWWEAQIGEMIDKNMIYPLDELADKYDKYFWTVANDQTLTWYTSDDGHIYQYPNSSFTPSDYEEYNTLASNETFLVRKDIFEAIGSPDMTTPEGFVAAVEKAAEMFPEVDGKELIPVGAHEFNSNGCDSFDGFLQDFLAVPYMKDGKAYDRLTDKDYVTWLKAFNKLGAEGLLKDDIFIDTRTQMEEKIAEGRYFCMLFQRTDLENAEMSLYNKNPDSIYIAIDGPKNSKGDDYALPGTSVNGWTVTLISKNCKNPEKAIKLISYLISEEGQIMTWLGVEGKTWEYDDKHIPRMKPEISKLLASDRTEFDRKYGADSCYWMFQNNAMASQWLVDDPDSPLTQLKEWTYPYTVYVGQYTIVFDAGTVEYEIKKRADAAWGKTLPKLLLAKNEKEFDRLYNDFIDERYETLGYGKVIDSLTEKMLENIEKMNIEE